MSAWTATVVWLGQAIVVILGGIWAASAVVIPSIIAGIFLLLNTIIQYSLMRRRDERLTRKRSR